MITIPPTPAALLYAAAQLDRFWTAMEARGARKPTLEEELQLRERALLGEDDD